MSGEVTSRAICGFLHVAGGDERPIRRVTSLREGTADAVVFAGTPEALAMALGSEAGMILATETPLSEARVVVVKNPRQAFALVFQRFFRPETTGSIHPTAVVEGDAELGAGCAVAAGAYVGHGVRMGEGCSIGPRAVLLPGTRLGVRVRVQAGAVLGAEGFGYVEGPQGFVQFPQIGTLEIGDDVEIGAGTTIDRGALEKTVIGRGTKIDNLVHIAHNCRIGEDVLIAAQVGIAGSSVVGDRAVLAGQVGIGEHVTVGEGVVLGAQAGVPSHKRVQGRGELFWGTPARPIQQYLKDLARLRRGR